VGVCGAGGATLAIAYLKSSEGGGGGGRNDKHTQGPGKEQRGERKGGE
jgi:hypothetical protein